MIYNNAWAESLYYTTISHVPRHNGSRAARTLAVMAPRPTLETERQVVAALRAHVATFRRAALVPIQGYSRRARCAPWAGRPRRPWEDPGRSPQQQQKLRQHFGQLLPNATHRHRALAWRPAAAAAGQAAAVVRQRCAPATDLVLSYCCALQYKSRTQCTTTAIRTDGQQAPAGRQPGWSYPAECVQGRPAALLLLQAALAPACSLSELPRSNY